MGRGRLRGGGGVIFGCEWLVCLGVGDEIWVL